LPLSKLGGKSEIMNYLIIFTTLTAFIYIGLRLYDKEMENLKKENDFLRKQNKQLFEQSKDSIIWEHD
jgi:cell division protein FtsB